MNPQATSKDNVLMSLMLVASLAVVGLSALPNEAGVDANPTPVAAAANTQKA